MSHNSKIFIALDTPDFNHALYLVEQLHPHIGGVKLGLEFFAAHGHPKVLKMIRKAKNLQLKVFLDLKFHDIPNTVGKAVKALAELQPDIITVHAAGGLAMMKAAKDNAPEGANVVAVTVLTSLMQKDLTAIGVQNTIEQQVEQLTKLARESGLDGIVCSGHELRIVKELWPASYCVVPGIRPKGDNKGDQRRIVTPSQALSDGADVLVIGRPITEATDPLQMVEKINRDIGLP